jgi:hypothetical protein
MQPQINIEDLDEEFDGYAVALRKIHRMRKPVYMESLWLRAFFDVEYLGLPLPSAPFCVGSESLMETDLDFIGATRSDRLAAERLRREQQRRLNRVQGWLKEFGCDFEALPQCLAAEFPYLADRSAEVLRAVVMAFVVDYEDLYTLSASIEGITKVMTHAAKSDHPVSDLPPDLPESVDRRRPRWYAIRKHKRPMSDLFLLPCFPLFTQQEKERILQCFKANRRHVSGWIDVVLGQGGHDPRATIRSRLRDVVRRTDLWSDQLIVLRSIQTLTILDVHHYCEMVWELGYYEEIEEKPQSFQRELPFSTNGATNRAAAAMVS